MWQVEDIIRAYDCSLTRIKREYIEQFGYTPEQKAELVDWYGNLVRMMNNGALLQSAKFPFYSSEYYRVLPFVVELRHRGADKQEHEIQTCFNALYGTMMLRLQKKPVTPETEHAIREITTLIGMLSDYYKADKAGELALMDNE